MKIDELFKQKIQIATLGLSLAEKEAELYELCMSFGVFPIAAAYVVYGKWFNAAAIGSDSPIGTVPKIKKKAAHHY